MPSRKREKAFEILEQNPEIHYAELAERAGYKSKGSAWTAKKAWFDENEPDDPGEQNPDPAPSGEGHEESESEPESPPTPSPGAGPSEPTAADLGAAGEPTHGSEPPEPDHSSHRETDPGENGQSITVEESSGNKLKPDDAPTAIEAPEGVPDDVRPADFELFPGSDSPPEENAPDESDSETETTDELIESAPDEDERERREDVVSMFESQSTDGGDGLEIDEDLIGELFGLPFDQADAVSEWDGWALSDREKETNARLFVAYCEERNIEVSTGTMLAVSLGSTVGGRAVRYGRWKQQQESDASEAFEEATGLNTREVTEADADEIEPLDLKDPDPNADADQAEATADGGAVDEHDESDGFNSFDPDTWPEGDNE